MTDVWVLSEESPGLSADDSGGCVCGVFTTAAAALLYLGSVELDAAALDDIVWHAWAHDAYEGHGHGTAVYILRRHAVQDEADLRALLTRWRRLAPTHGNIVTRTTAELQAMLTAPDQEQRQRQMTAFLRRAAAKEAPC